MLVSLLVLLCFICLFACLVFVFVFVYDFVLFVLLACLLFLFLRPLVGEQESAVQLVPLSITGMDFISFPKTSLPI